jgi:hypothetical protein
MRGMYILRHNQAVWIILRWLLRGRLGGSVVMHDAGNRHDTSSVLQDLWAAALEEDEADPCGVPDPTDPDDCMSERHAAQLGTRTPEWVYDIPLGTAQDRNKWDRYRPDILIAVEGIESNNSMAARFI